MRSAIATTTKATIKHIIVAFIYVIIILIATNIIFKKPIQELKLNLELITVKTNKVVSKEIKLDLNTKTLTSYPKYGKRYATLKIPSVSIEQPVYYGSDLDILKYGVGQDVASYFPGEGNSILYMGHNTQGMLHTLPNVKLGDTITVETVYGTFNYKITNTKVIEETDLDAVAIKKGKETLMIYTCYPVTAIVHTPYRFLVYADLT